jgi:hypothetical protein
MNKQIIFPALFSLALFSCGNQASQPEKTGEETSPIEVKSCYRYTKGNDTITLQTTTIGDKITGELIYDWFEKDRNSGKISGKVKGDTLITDYTFMSEGLASVREEVFLKKGNDLLIGYGDAEEKGNKWVFTNYGQLKFDAIQLKNIPCE